MSAECRGLQPRGLEREQVFSPGSPGPPTQAACLVLCHLVLSVNSSLPIWGLPGDWRYLVGRTVSRVSSHSSVPYTGTWSVNIS